jgi:Flp pilus assembly protein TadD
MKSPQLVSRGSIERMLKSAEEAWNRKDFQQSIDLLERACRLDPANSGIFMNLGQCYGQRSDYASAERCFDKAIRVAPQKTEIMARVAQMAAGFFNARLAEHYFAQTLKQPDATPETFARLADFYEHLSRLDEASALASRALEKDSACAWALLVRARLDRRAGKLEDAERRLKLFVDKAEREVRIRGYYELGMVLDRLGRYDEAMSAFVQGKDLLRPDAPPLMAYLQVERAKIKERQAGIKADMLRRWAEAGASLEPKRRLAFLGGHPRSGTTLLEQVLDSHPGIISAEELDSFRYDAFKPLSQPAPPNSSMAEVLESAPVNALQRSRAGYFRSMEMSLGTKIGDRLLVDKNPAMTLFLPAYIRIFPEIKILIALRDPRDLVMSCFMQVYVPISLGSVSYLSLKDTIDGYTVLMGTWRALRASITHPCLEVKYEDVVQDLESVSHRALEFLGVPWDSKVLHFDEHAKQKRVRTPSYADVVKPVFKTAMGRWRNYQKYLEPHLEKLEPFVKAFGYE